MALRFRDISLASLVLFSCLQRGSVANSLMRWTWDWRSRVQITATALSSATWTSCSHTLSLSPCSIIWKRCILRGKQAHDATYGFRSFGWCLAGSEGFGTSAALLCATWLGKDSTFLPLNVSKKRLLYPPP